VVTHKRHRDKKTYRALFDPGASNSLIGSRFAKGDAKMLPVKKRNVIQWKTPNGVFTTKNRVSIPFYLSEFSTSKKITWIFNVASHDIGYDMIIGRDLLLELGIIIDFAKKTMSWDETTIEMPTVAEINSVLKN